MGSKPEILSRLAQTTAALTRLKPIWNDSSRFLSSTIRLMLSLVTSIFIYACELLTLTAELQRRIQAMQMRCCLKILRISYKDNVINEEVRAKIQQAIIDHGKETQTDVVWTSLPFIRSGLNHLAVKGGRDEDTADRGRGGKTTSGNGQAWSSPNSRGQWRTEKTGENWL